MKTSQSRKKVLFALSFSLPAFLGALGAAQAQSQSPPAAPKQGEQKTQGNLEQQFRGMDRNRDGYLTLDELTPEFHRIITPMGGMPQIDRNWDRRLSQEEYVQAMQIAAQQEGGQPPLQVQVQQPQPEVRVQQQAPKVQVSEQREQVQVQQLPPQVSVQQAQPEVQVTQPKPEVTVEQAQPKIRVSVEQPQPKVQVEQPKAQVDVQQAKPEVSVQQPQPKVTVKEQQPEVSVQQAQPEVSVQQHQPEVRVIQPKPEVIVQQQEPDIQVSQAQPEVEVKQAQPEVSVQQAQPQVQVKQAEPKVSVSQQQPEVTIKEQGQPQIVTDQGTQDSSQRQAKAEQPQTSPAEQGQPQADRALWSMTPKQLTGRSVYNNLGQEIGDIEKVVQDSRDQGLAAVVSIGGFFGLGQKQIAVDLSDLSVDQDRLILDTRKSEDQLENRPAYNAQAYRDIQSTNETIGQLMQSGQ